MSTESTSKAYNALYPYELISRYSEGERNFEKINLLRKELEHILGPNVDTNLIQTDASFDKYNPLWSDFHEIDSPDFEWDSFGHFSPI